MNIRVLQQDDYSLVKKFILENHKAIEDPDFFIVDDIDTALPAMFTGTGVVYGAYVGDELIGVHGLDFSQENHTLISPHVAPFVKDKPLAEMGWTMVKKAFQGQGVASSLIALSEKEAPSGYDYIVTVHPANVAALKAYLKNGYQGVTLQTYYGKPRVFLIKRSSGVHAEEKYVKEVPLEKLQAECFLDGDVLVKVEKQGGRYCAKFVSYR